MPEVGIAETGSGKTLAFLLPAIVHINASPPPRSRAPDPFSMVWYSTVQHAIVCYITSYYSMLYHSIL